MATQFWWGQQEEERRMHWVKWDKLTLLKEDGEMGFKDLRIFNFALLAKMAWRMIQEPEALWMRLLKGLYFPREELL